MEISDLQKLRSQIAEGKLFDVINDLRNLNFNSDLNNRVSVLSSSFHKIRKREVRGEYDYSVIDRQFIGLTYKVLDLLSDIELLIVKKEERNDIVVEINNLELLLKNNKDVELEITENKLNSHLDKVKKWSEIVKFNDLKKSKSILRVYIDLDFFVVPMKFHFSNEDSKQCRLEDILLEKDNIILFGQPGAGKTTTVKRLVQSFLNEDNHVVNRIYNHKLCIRLRELNNEVYSDEAELFLFQEILQIFGIRLSLVISPPRKNSTSKHINRYNSAKRLLIDLSLYIIDRLKAFIILDGYDELNYKYKGKAVDQIRLLSSRLSTSRFLVTSRSGDFDSSVDHSNQYEISPLNDNQIRVFIERWLDNPKLAQELTNKIKVSPFYDTAMRPLTLAHICAIFERYGDIPEKPVDVYKKTIRLLIEEWDSQRGIKRRSKFGRFVPERKEKFLAELAYVLGKGGYSIFSRDSLFRAYNEINSKYELPAYEAEKVFKEIENHSGLLVQSGFDSFEFSHKSIQEYLIAKYIVGLPQVSRREEGYLPNELAIAVAIASDSNLYLCDLVYRDVIFKSVRELSTFLNRIILEKPDFYPDALLGFTVLNLFSRNRDQVSNNYDVVQVMKKFLKLRNIKRSISLCLEFYKIRSSTLGPEYSFLTYNHKYKNNFRKISGHKFDILSLFIEQ